jgi:hypothetical protein
MLTMENRNENIDENITYYQPSFYETFPEAFQLTEETDDEETSIWEDGIPAELLEENGNFKPVDIAFLDDGFPISNDNKETSNADKFSFFDYPKISEKDLQAAVNNRPIRWEIKFHSNIKIEMN